MKATDANGPQDGSHTDIAALGVALRSARLGRHLSVESLAQTSGVSSGSISQLERGQGNPSLVTLRRLAAALGVPLFHFLQGPSATGMVVRADERKRLALPESELVYELLTPHLQGRLEVLRTRVPAGFTNQARPFVHEGEECVHLLSGTLEVTIGRESFALQEGDSVTYDSSTPHWWANTTKRAATMIGAVTPPSF